MSLANDGVKAASGCFTSMSGCGCLIMVIGAGMTFLAFVAAVVLMGA